MRAVKTGLAVAAGVLLLTGCTTDKPAAAPASSAPAAAGAPSAGPSAGAQPVASAAPSAAPSAGTDRPAAVTGIDGTAYYRDFDTLYSVRGSTVRKLLKSRHDQHSVSPDGRHLALLGDERLAITDAQGRNAREFKIKIRQNGSSEQSGAYWTADSASVLVDRVDSTDKAGNQKVTAGTVRISDGRFTAFPQSVQGNQAYRITGDGQRLFYRGKGCSIYSARLDGTDIRRVPGLGGDLSTAENPNRLQACDLGAVNHDGSRIVATLHRVSAGNDEAGLVPFTVVDTATGKVQPLAVPGRPVATLILRDGSMLVRSVAEDGRKHHLTLLSAAGRKITSKVETGLPSVSLRDYAA